MITGRANRVTRYLEAPDRRGERQTRTTSFWNLECCGQLAQANTAELRERAWQLVYETYMLRGYAHPRSRGLRVLLQDALPESATFVAEESPRGDLPLATLTVIPDSPLCLPMDSDCPEEMAKLRNGGQRLCEVAMLAVRQTSEGSVRVGSTALLHLFRLAYLKAARIDKADYLIASVIPKHARFYQKVLLFEPLGQPRQYGSVQGTTGVPMKLDLRTAEQRYMKKYDHRKGVKNLYRLFINDEEPAILQWLQESGQKMTEDQVRLFLVEYTALLQRASRTQRAYIRSRYPEYALDRMFIEATRSFFQ